MKFEDFRADIDNTIIVWANEAPLRRLRFSIGASILTRRLGISNPVHVEQNIERCRAQRPKIIAACERAYKRDPAIEVTLTPEDFEDSAQESPPQPPTDVAGG
jgi:hypothetical protein